VVVSLVVLLLVGCGASSSPDPRFRVDSPEVHYTWLVKRINKSDLWRAYFQARDPSKSRLLVEFRLGADRSTLRSVGGDYDPGSAVVSFEVTSSVAQSTLFKSSQKLSLPSFEVGFYPADATREEIQEIVFKETEELLYPILGNWVEVAALRAIRQEGAVGAIHVPLLKNMLDDPWTNDELRGEARETLAAIQ
jgi:hypothetical protein